jgi:hypothetical protein
MAQGLLDAPLSRGMTMKQLVDDDSEIAEMARRAAKTMTRDDAVFTPDTHPDRCCPRRADRSMYGGASGMAARRMKFRVNMTIPWTVS